MRVSISFVPWAHLKHISSMACYHKPPHTLRQQTPDAELASLCFHVPLMISPCSKLHEKWSFTCSSHEKVLDIDTCDAILFVGRLIIILCCIRQQMQIINVRRIFATMVTQDIINLPKYRHYLLTYVFTHTYIRLDTQTYIVSFISSLGKNCAKLSKIAVLIWIID